MAKPSAPKIGLIIPGALTLLVISALLFNPGRSMPRVAFHQDYIEGRYPEIQDSLVDLNNIDQVFDLVFSSLRDEVKVYPTENYYYFVFSVKDGSASGGKNGGRPIWGNIHFPPAAEIGDYVDFAYWTFESDPEKVGAPDTHYKKFDTSAGIVIKKLAPLKFSVSYQGKSVIFSLNDIDQKARPAFSLRGGEVVAEHTFDESGYAFFLIYNKTAHSFLFVLDESSALPEAFRSQGGNILVGKKTGFAFYQDGDRKILMAVSADNVTRNNYFDGPFDQLADNFITDRVFSGYLQEAFPYAKGRIDQYGRFTDVGHSRLALIPYRFYRDFRELPAIIKGCAGQELSGCITHDPKEASGS